MWSSWPCVRMQRLDLPATRFEVGEVRDDQVDAEQVRLGKHRAGVDDDGRLPTRDGHRVEAELAEAAKRHDIDWRSAAIGRGVHRTDSSQSQPRRHGPRALRQAEVAGSSALRTHLGRRWTQTGMIQAAGRSLEKRGGLGRNYSTASDLGRLAGRVGPARASAARPSSAGVRQAGDSASVQVSGRRFGSIPAVERGASILAATALANGRQRIRQHLPPLREHRPHDLDHQLGSSTSGGGGRNASRTTAERTLGAGRNAPGGSDSSRVTSAPERRRSVSTPYRRSRARRSDDRPPPSAASASRLRTRPACDAVEQPKQDRRRDVVGEVADDARPCVGCAPDRVARPRRRSIVEHVRGHDGDVRQCAAPGARPRDRDRLRWRRAARACAARGR